MPHRALAPHRALVLGPSSDLTRRLAAQLSVLGLAVITLHQLARKDAERVRGARVVVFCQLAAEQYPDARQLHDYGIGQAILLAMGGATGTATPLHATLATPVRDADLLGALATAGYQAPAEQELAKVNETLLRLVNGNTAVTAELVSSLLVTALSDLADYQRECAERNWVAASARAHRLAGTARMAGCATLTALSTRARRSAPKATAPTSAH
ncbi:hypothetical protein DDE05_11320 [Streptomyces cavourensis]|nr:hypothetical protein DDE05_11320 [Streptomyces cavourensis]